MASIFSFLCFSVSLFLAEMAEASESLSSSESSSSLDESEFESSTGRVYVLRS